MIDLELRPGSVAWATLDPVIGREQGGRRPVLVVASHEYLEVVTTLVIVAPITSIDRGWANHVRVDGPSGLPRDSWVMTEQPRTLARARLFSIAGEVSPACLAEVQVWLTDFLRT